MSAKRKKQKPKNTELMHSDQSALPSRLASAGSDERRTVTRDLPSDFISMYRLVFGEAEWEAYRAAWTNATAHKGLRANSRKGFSSRPSIENDPVPWATGGFYLPPSSQAPVPEVSLGQDPLHAAGCYYLQEPSAMAPATALAPKNGERALDLCAAPGGKAAQLADFIGWEGWLLANEIHGERALALAENTERMGLPQTTIANLAPDNLAQMFPICFDAVLVDAPCSGEGMFRKDEGAVRHWHKDLPAVNANRQIDILEAALRTLRPGGRLVYSTCTLNPIENEAVISAILIAHPELELLPLSLPGARPALSPADLRQASERYAPLAAWMNKRGAPLEDEGDPPTNLALRLSPAHCRGEGHFVALIRKRAGAAEPASADPGGKKTFPGGGALNDSPAPKNASALLRMPPTTNDERELVQAFAEFCADALTAAFVEHLKMTHAFVPRGHTLYAVPKAFAETVQQDSRLRGILRPGLPLMRRISRHFAPEHALALAMRPQDARRAVDFSYGDPWILAYLRGEELPLSGSPGYTLVCVSGASLGWGKQANERLKNLYPKGLRRQHHFAFPAPLSGHEHTL